jgi:outer membrane protein
MKHLKSTRLLIALLLGVLISTATVAKDLMEVYTLALKSDPQLLAEAASRRAVDELDSQAKAQFLPQFDVSANTGYIWQEVTTINLTAGKRDFDIHGYTLSVTQPVYRKQNFIQQTQADIAIEGATASYLIAEQALIIRVSERYFDVLARQDDVTFAIAEREAIAQQLEQIKQRFDVGMATITDVAESQAAYDLANAAVIGTENELANSGERLRESAGNYIKDLTTLNTDSPLVSPQPTDIDQWSDVALAQNPNILVSRSEVDNATQSIKLQKSGHYPTLDLVGQKSYVNQSDSNFGGSIASVQQSLSLQFNLPIDVAGNVRSRTREAEYRLDQSMQNEEQQRRIVIRQTREAYNGVMAGISRVKALKQAVSSSEIALESTTAGYEVGTRTTVDVLNVRRDLFRARRDYSQARYDYIVNTLRLKQAAGTLGVNDVALVNDWLDS